MKRMGGGIHVGGPGSTKENERRGGAMKERIWRRGDGKGEKEKRGVGKEKRGGLVSVG